jgi:MtfA peptidase
VLAALRRWQRKRILRRHAIPDPLWTRIVDEVAVLRALDSDDRKRLRELTVMFLHGKQFYGAHDMAVDMHMKTSIAAQACLLVLNLGLDYYRGWRTVLIYEGAFVARHEYEDEAGLVHEEESALEGETSLQGPVILAWDEVERAYHGYGAVDFPGNVVLHEFAHKLDYLNGEANGFPPLHASMSSDEWSDSFVRAYESFARAVDACEATDIDSYAAENPAEFFAVATETFFVAPAVLTAFFPEIFQQLALFYRQDPLSRQQPH